MSRTNCFSVRAAILVLMLGLGSLGFAGTGPAFLHPASPDPAPLYAPVWDMPAGPSEFPVNIVTSRNSGVGPLYVFFDASTTLLAADGKADLGATYIWSFDTSNVDADTKYERVCGFVAGHVFNSTGTYTVRLDVFDQQRRHGYGITTITVTPFSGTTYYVASTGSDTNTGTTMQSPIQTARHALLDLAKPNTRILFRNGDVFTIDQDLRLP